MFSYRILIDRSASCFFAATASTIAALILLFMNLSIRHILEYNFDPSYFERITVYNC